jgi:hypothetical protein
LPLHHLIAQNTPYKPGILQPLPPPTLKCKKKNIRPLITPILSRDAAMPPRFRPPQHHATAPFAAGAHTELHRCCRILQRYQPPHTPSGSGDALSSWRGSATAGATAAAAPSSPTTINSISSGRLPLQRAAALPPTGSMAYRTCRPPLHGVPHLPPAAPWRARRRRPWRQRPASRSSVMR